VRQGIAILVGGLLGASVGPMARAQQSEDLTSQASQASQSSLKPLEVEVGAGYFLGFGTMAPRQSYDGVPGSGSGVAAGLDYRLSWRWALGIQGQYYDFSSDSSSPARGLAANLGATWHFNRARRAAPWLRLGTGYRALWVGDPSSATGDVVLRSGFELATVTAGYDAALSTSIAVAPVLGAGLDVFVWRDATGGIGQSSSTRAGSFIYTGLQGRFALGD